MASTIKIKRSGTTEVPASGLGAGELAYSWKSGVDKLYIGWGTETDGVAQNIAAIGGKYYTDTIDAATSANTANTLVKRDASGNITVGTITGTISGNASTATTLQTSRNFSASGDATAPNVSFNGSQNVNLVLTLANSGVTANTYGSSTAIPVLTIDAKGRITSASTQSISTTLNIAGNSGTDGVALGADTLTFTGTAPIVTAVTNNTLTISASDASTSAKGVASFSSTNFAVTSGAVSIKTGGVPNTALVNSSVTIGTTSVALGATSTSLAGITELTVDNLNFNGNTITSTDTNGNITLSPNGTGVVDVADSRISGVATPVNDTDAANKAYVDNSVSGLTWKNSVHLLAASNVALTGSTSTLVIDGHAALDVTDAGYRLLLIGQTTTSQNGIYVYNDNGTSYTLTRASDADTFQELVGAAVFVKEGTLYANTGWVQSEHYLTDFTNQDWVQFSGAGAYTAGAGLTQSGTIFNVGAGDGITVNADNVALSSTVAGAGLTFSSGVVNVGGTTNRITVNTDSIDIASTYVGQTSITTLGTIGTGTWQGTVVSPTYGGTGVNNGTKTITLGGNFTHTGAHTLGLTTTGNTSVTLPTTGTLATLAGTEELTNKTITGATISTGSINNTPIGASTRNTGAFTTLAANGAVTLSAGTASTNTTTGTLVVTGGVGISGAINVGGNLTGSGTSVLDGFAIDGGTY